MNLNKNDIHLLEDAADRGAFGILSHKYFAAARKRLVLAGYIFERDVHVRLGQYRSTLRITQEGRDALRLAKEPK